MQYVIVAVLVFLFCFANVSSTDVKFRHDILLPKYYYSQQKKTQSHVLIRKVIYFWPQLKKNKAKVGKSYFNLKKTVKTTVRRCG